MTKEELDKEAIAKYKTGSYPQLHPDHYAFIHGYLAGAEPREKHIAALDKENGKLEGKLADLQSEYIELENFHNNEVNKLKVQLNKAKEIIIDLVEFDGSYKDDEEYQRTSELYDKICEEAEQFLKEAE